MRALVVTYLASIPLSIFFIQQSGMGWKVGMHHSAGDVLGGILMICVVWAPLTCVYLSWILLPLAALAAYVVAGRRRATSDRDC